LPLFLKKLDDLQWMKIAVYTKYERPPILEAIIENGLEGLLPVRKLLLDLAMIKGAIPVFKRPNNKAFFCGLSNNPDRTLNVRSQVKSRRSGCPNVIGFITNLNF